MQFDDSTDQSGRSLDWVTPGHKQKSTQKPDLVIQISRNSKKLQKSFRTKKISQYFKKSSRNHQKVNQINSRQKQSTSSKNKTRNKSESKLVRKKHVKLFDSQKQIDLGRANLNSFKKEKESTVLSKVQNEFNTDQLHEEKIKQNLSQISFLDNDESKPNSIIQE